VNLSADVIVIGGGVAGLSAALHLAERGLHPLVLEADPHFYGGRLAGGDEIEVNGWRFRGEHGVHGIWSPYRNLQAMLARHNLRPVLIPAQEESWAYQRNLKTKMASVGSAIRNSRLPAPFHYLNLFFRPGFWAVAGSEAWMSVFLVWYGLLYAMAVDPLKENQPLEDLWLKDLVRYWPPKVRAFLIGLARNGLAARPEEVPLSGFIAFLRFYTLLRRDAWHFGYLPEDGGTSVIEPLVNKVIELGGQAALGRRVTRLEKIALGDGEGAGWRVYWREAVNENGAQETEACLTARLVILAADASNAKAILQASPGLKTAGLYFPRSMETAVARFWFDHPPRPTPEAGIFSGEFVADNFFWLHELQDSYRAWSKSTGGSAIEVHIYGPPEMLAVQDAVLLAYANRDVLTAFPELRGHLLHQVLQRNPPTHTLFGVGAADRHLGIRSPWPGLLCCGDWVRHPSPAFFLERACVTGIEAANAVLADRELPPWALLDYLPPEPLAGWIEKGMQLGRRLVKKKKPV
jgi:isorenieratene synthase